MTRTLPFACALALGAAAALAACQSSSPGSPAVASAPTPSTSEFMAANAKAPGVMSAEGIQYQVLSSGPAAGAHPSPQDDVTVQYEGTLLSGKVFDATPAGQSVTFQLGGLIPGWVTALQMMRPGDEWRLWIPPEFGYGDSAAGPIPPGSLLVFRIRLVSVQPHAA